VAELLLDTNILVDVVRAKPEAIALLVGMEQQDTLMISSVTRMELIVGCRNKSELRKLDRFLNRFREIPLEAATCALAIRLLSRFAQSHGLTIGDALIGATALSRGIPLATYNQRDFSYVPGLRLVVP
jgi:predicted nucleic acid-binding protein